MRFSVHGCSTSRILKPYLFLIGQYLLGTAVIAVDALDPRDDVDFRVTGGTKVAGVFKVVQKEGQQAASSYTAASVEW